MKTLLSIALLVGTIVPASAITVSSPANGAQVTSPFTLIASTTACGGVPAVSMGYSIDSGSAIIEPTSFAASVLSAPGAHILHVKCWGKHTNEQVLLNIMVGSSTATDITVASPVSNATLTSPFTVAANSTTCGGVPAVSMGYSIDGGQAVIEPISFIASVAAASGSHVLHVKCWGTKTSAQVLLPITVLSAPAAATPTFSLAPGQYTTKQAVGLSAATPGSTIFYTLDGSAPSTSSLVYSGSIAVTGNLTIEAIAVASGYSTSGVARADYSIVASKGPSIPSYATKQTSIQLLPGWRIKHDPGTPGISTGAMSLVSDPSLSGQAQEFYTTFTEGGGELYSLDYATDANAKNFVYDAQVWIAEGSQIANLEMDNNQVMPNGDTVIYAFQCSGYSNTWEYSANVGTRTAPIVKWLRSTSPCNPATWEKNAWHHVQISYSRDDAGNITYRSVWLDGVEYDINQTVPGAFTLGWAPGALVTNFQVDGIGSGTATLDLDNLTIDRW